MVVQAAQESFRQAQASYDPNNMLQHLAFFPYHVDGLMAMTDLERALGHNEQAEDYLQRAVYALEMAWPSRCNPAVADVEMSFDEAINRPLFRALFLHAQVSLWGCVRARGWGRGRGCTLKCNAGYAGSFCQHMTWLAVLEVQQAKRL